MLEVKLQCDKCGKDSRELIVIYTWCQFARLLKSIEDAGWVCDTTGDHTIGMFIYCSKECAK